MSVNWVNNTDLFWRAQAVSLTIASYNIHKGVGTDGRHNGEAVR